MENRRKARERQRRKRRMMMAATGTAAVVLLALGIWLMIGRTGKAKLSEDSGETMQEQTMTSVSDTGDDAGDNSQDVEQASVEEDQEAEEAEAWSKHPPCHLRQVMMQKKQTVPPTWAVIRYRAAMHCRQDLDDNTIVSQKGAYDRISPASMTKILTVLVAAEHVTDLDDTFTITKEITDFSYSHDCSAVGFLDEETVTVPGSSLWNDPSLRRRCGCRSCLLCGRFHGCLCGHDE